jgi:uncharacterized protein (DUF1330 family)
MLRGVFVSGLPQSHTIFAMFSSRFDGVVVISPSCQRRLFQEPSMPHAYVIGHIRVVDPDAWAAYRSQVPATLEPWQGELLLRGRLAEVFSGEHHHTNTVALRFPDLVAARGWHASPAYQALIPLRQRAAEVTLLLYEE